MNHELVQIDIFIVDDHPNNLQVLSTLLAQEGYRVRKATSGVFALKSIQSSLPDLMLLDIQMPEMDGYELCSRLKADAATSEIPILFLSAMDDVNDKVKAFSVGGADYITKPFQAIEVLARVKHHLTIQQQRKQLIEQNQRLQQETQERQRLEQELRQANFQLEYLVNVDGLTQVANRRCFNNFLEQEWRRLMREQQPLSLILCDVDYFKRFNDHYGHLKGDDCLRQVAAAIKAAVKRPADLVARYGGEEFAIVLPNTDLKGAIAVAEAVRTMLQRSQIPHAGSEVEKIITLSLGIGSMIPQIDVESKSLIAIADQALYEAKKQGRDRLCYSPAPAANV